VLRVSRRAPALALALALGCGGRAPSTEAPSSAERIWVLAPHPDDEVLMAGATLLGAVAQGVEVEVVVMTNGDLSCERNGWRRQDETIAALAELGVTEAHVHFLGYPDGWLDALAVVPLGPFERAAPDGSCGTGATTYGARGAEHADVHTALTGAAATYTEANVLFDLGALLDALPPTTIHVPHAIDTHPDHAATYALLRRALDRTLLTPRLVRHVVHAGMDWPAVLVLGATTSTRPFAGDPFPPLPEPLAGYAADALVEVAPTAVGRWHDAIGCYVSQLDGPVDGSWLSSFARTTEAGWSQQLVRSEGGLAPENAGLSVDAPLRAGERFAFDGCELRREVSLAEVWCGEVRAASVAIPEPEELETLSIRLAPAGTAHVEIEILRGGRFLGGGVARITTDARGDVGVPIPSRRDSEVAASSRSR
jgi:LmbE family N-acetylglucosaminyl deacetylase